MKRPYLETILLSFLLVSCAGASANAQSGEPAFAVTTKNTDDQIDIQHQNGMAIIDVTSPSGIGAATLELESGVLPGNMIVRLHLKGLEEFRLTSAQTSVAASVSNSNPSEVHQRIIATSSDSALSPDHPLWMKIEIVSEQTVKTLPLEEGYFEVTIPKDFIQKAGTSFEITWIDFHR